MLFSILFYRILDSQRIEVTRNREWNKWCLLIKYNYGTVQREYFKKGRNLDMNKEKRTAVGIIWIRKKGIIKHTQLKKTWMLPIISIKFVFPFFRVWFFHTSQMVVIQWSLTELYRLTMYNLMMLESMSVRLSTLSAQHQHLFNLKSGVNNVKQCYSTWQGSKIIKIRLAFWAFNGEVLWMKGLVID